MAKEATGSRAVGKTASAVADEETAPDATEASAAMTDEQRDAAATKLVDRFSLWSGAAGLIPIPIADAAVVAGVQLEMLRRLSKIYNVPFSENRGKSVIASLAGSMLPATAAMGIVSAAKSLPLIGTTIATVTMPALASGATYVIGRVFIQHFASGGSLLDFNPGDYREFIKAQKAKLRFRSSTTPAAAPASTKEAASTST